MGDMRNTHRILIENLKGRQNLECPVIMRWVFEKYCMIWPDMSGFGPKPKLGTRIYIYENPWVQKWWKKWLEWKCYCYFLFFM